jgi:hypothetical protein
MSLLKLVTILASLTIGGLALTGCDSDDEVRGKDYPHDQNDYRRDRNSSSRTYDRTAEDSRFTSSRDSVGSE